MGVRTTADEKIDETKEHIDDAIKSLRYALDMDTWGSDQYNDEYLGKLEKVLLKLHKIKRKIK